MIVAEHPTQVLAEIDHDQGIEPITLRLPPEWCLTDQALMAISSLNEAVRFERSEEGALIISPPPSGPSSPLSGRIYSQIERWADNVGGGEARESSAGYLVGENAVRGPDVSWMTQEQLESLGVDGYEEGYAPFCPPFVVEVVSPRDSLTAQQRKMEAWLNYGVRLGWLIDRRRSLAWIYRPGQQEPELLERPSELSGEDVLPGLTVECSRIWKPVKSGDSQ